MAGNSNRDRRRPVMRRLLLAMALGSLLMLFLLVFFAMQSMP